MVYTGERANVMGIISDLLPDSEEARDYLRGIEGGMVSCHTGNNTIYSPLVRIEMSPDFFRKEFVASKKMFPNLISRMSKSEGRFEIKCGRYGIKTPGSSGVYLSEITKDDKLYEANLIPTPTFLDIRFKMPRESAGDFLDMVGKEYFPWTRIAKNIRIGLSGI